MNTVIGGRYNIEYGNSVSLVPGRKDAFEQLGLAVHLGIKLGAKHKSVESIVAPQIERIQASTDKVRRLAADKSRNPTQKHLVAEALAKELTADLQRTHDRVAKIADGLVDDGEAEVRSVLGPRSEYAYLYAEAMRWVRESKGTAEGMALINEAYRDNLEVAAAIYNGPRQMMGLGKDVHTIMAGNIAGLWAPNGWKALNEGLDVQKTLKNYEPLIGDIHGAYYNPAVVAEAEASRVEV